MVDQVRPSQEGGEACCKYREMPLERVNLTKGLGCSKENG